MFHVQGTKRRASQDSDFCSLGPPAKIQKQDSLRSEEDVEPKEPINSAEASEDIESQLSLASQPSQNEPAVVLSSPDELAAAEQEGTEPLKSEAMIENDDDSVFAEPPEEEKVNIESSDPSSILPSTTSGDSDEMMALTEAAIQTECHSPTMRVGSPEIPLQSSGQAMETVFESARRASLEEDDERGVSVRTSVSSDDGEEDMEEVEEEEGGGGGGEVVDDGGGADHRTSLAESMEMQGQPTATLLHDHSYFSQSKLLSSSASRSASEPHSSAAIQSTAGLDDHAYCNLGAYNKSVSEHMRSDETLNDLRCKLSANAQDHNYCRVSSPDASPSQQQQEQQEPLAVPGVPEPDTVESQELFSVDHASLPNYSSSVDTIDIVTGAPQSCSGSPPVREDGVMSVGCQISPDCTEVSVGTEGLHISADTTDISLSTSHVSLDSSLKSVIDSMSEQDDLSSGTLWRLQQQLLRGLSLVSSRMERFCSDTSSDIHDM